MTERLYYKDANLLEFEAEIIESGMIQNKYYTVLDRSAFYPTSGGQLFDTGLINNIAIVDVIEDDNNQVRHISLSKIGDAGNKVSGSVDQQRRLRLKQQHTAQHILSHSFKKLYDLRTESVHLGEEYGAIELNSSNMTHEQLQQVEMSANEIVQNNLPVEILFVNSEDINKLPLRKIPKRIGEIRIIKIGEIEYSACGGTHCDNTAQVGFIKIIGTEKIRSRILVKFLCGIQLFKDYSGRFEVTERISQILTCHYNDLPGKIEKLIEENRLTQRELSLTQKELLPQKAQKIANKSEKIKNVPFVFHDLGSFDKKSTGQLAGMVSEIIQGLAVLAFDGKLSIASGPECTLDAGQIAGLLSQKTDLKGGGNKKAAQLGNADKDKLSEYKNLIIEIISDE